MKHLAQFNVARARYQFNDPRMAEFFAVTPKINALAERSDGFVWRQTDEEKIPNLGDGRILGTLSVWRDLNSLSTFTWNTVHRQFRMRTHEWFEPMDQAYLVCWHIPVGHHPTAEEAVEQLKALREHGPNNDRFGTEALKTAPA